eukprot:2091253-Rhodomonas_salina.2
MAGGDNNNGGVLTIMAVILTTMVGGSAAMARGATNALSSQVCALADSVGVRRRSCRCAQDDEEAAKDANPQEAQYFYDSSVP